MKIPSKLIVITGPPRSGTTLLNRILCSSPECSPFISESTFITAQIRLYANILMYADKERFSAYFNTGENCLACFQECINAHLESLLKASSHLAGYEYLVLKDPMLSPLLTYARALFPNETRFVVIVRNPYSIVASMKMVTLNQGRKWDLKHVCTEIANYYYQLNLYKESTNDDLLCFVRYEDLVSGETDELESFLGFPLQDRLLQSKHKRTFCTDDPFYSPLIEKPASESRVDSWKNEITYFEKRYIRKEFSHTIAFWNYGKF